MPKFSFLKRDVSEAAEKDSGKIGDGHVHTLVAQSDVPTEYKGRVAAAIIEGNATVENGTVSVTIADDS